MRLREICLFCLALYAVQAWAFTWPLQDCPAPNQQQKPLGHSPAPVIPPKKPPPPVDEKAVARAAFASLCTAIERDSKFRDVSDELFQYGKAAQKIGMPTEVIHSFVSRYQAIGKRSLAREKASCTNTPDHNKQLGPPRNQDSLGWCYAFAASDALSYSVGKKISAAALAINYNSYFSFINHLFQPNCSEGEISAGGDSMISWMLANFSGGACLESEVPSQDRANTTLYNVLKDLDSYKRSPKQASICAACLAGYFPELSQSTVHSIIEKSSRADLAKNLSAASCKTKVKLGGLHLNFKLTPIDGIQKTMDELDSAINNNTVPIVTFASTLLYNIDAKPADDHEMVVVSRRFNTTKNECEYLVRNSWGTGCRQYDRRLPCSNGSFWVTKSVLSRGLDGVQSIK